jgi:hypothetical protein
MWRRGDVATHINGQQYLRFCPRQRRKQCYPPKQQQLSNPHVLSESRAYKTTDIEDRFTNVAANSVNINSLYTDILILDLAAAPARIVRSHPFVSRYQRVCRTRRSTEKHFSVHDTNPSHSERLSKSHSGLARSRKRVAQAVI